MFRRSRWSVLWSVPLLASVFLFAGCGVEGQEFSELKQFQTCQELEDYMKEVATREYTHNNRRSSGGGFGIPMGGMASAPTADASSRQENTNKSAAGNAGSGGSEPSTLQRSDTNNQVVGVDEADIVKNDGKHIYVVNRNYFLIFKSWPAKETKEIARYKMTTTPREMYVHNGLAVIFSDDSKNYRKIFASNRPAYDYGSRVTRIVILNIKNRTKPFLVREMSFEGTYQTSRRIDQSVRVVLSNRFPMPRVDYSKIYNNGSSSSTFGFVRENKERELYLAAIKKTTLKDWLPLFQDKQYKDSKLISNATNLVGDTKACTGFYKPTVMSGRGVVSVVSIDLMDPMKNLKNTAVISDYKNTYASRGNLYVASAPAYYVGAFGPGDTRTYLHKFDISKANTQAKYIASGAVPGTIINQFAMDEHKGYFRIATTNRGNDGSLNNIFVLQQQSNKLEVVGKVTGLAKGEQIRSARFMGDRGFIVTFRQVDPLFTIDLKDPKNPKAVGELKIPGFSTYLHPLDDNNLLAIGMDGTNQGVNGDIQLSIFNVSNFANPKQVAKVSIKADAWSQGTSQALYNHKAFNYYSAKKLLSIPVSSSSYKPGNKGFFSGALLFKIDLKAKDMIRSFGKIEHTDLASKSTGGEPKTGDDDGRYGYGTTYQIQRSIFIENFVYTISPMGMKVNNLDNLANKVVDPLLFP
jgi:hypothetical protein